MACPNINLESWKLLVSARGEDVAYYLWDKYDGNVPESESNQSIIKSGLKATNALQSDKAIQLFSTLEKNKVKGDAFWNKIQTDLQIPKEQIELIKQYDTTDREQLITNMLSDYSYAIEINIAKEVKPVGSNEEYFDESGRQINKEEFKNLSKDRPTQIYSNLTVPGGTNYTENEIATPAITPSIKGHAQFATDKGIGWFRSDDKENKVVGWKEEDDFLNSETAQYNPITKNDKIIFGHPTIGKSYLKKNGANNFITLDDDYADEVNTFVDKNRGSETRQEYKGRKPKEYNEFMLNLFDRLKVQAKKEGKRLFVSNTNILKERMSEFDKVITIPKEEFKKRFDARGATYGFEDWKSDIDATVAKVDKSKVISTTGYLSDLLEGNPKTRRILEVQSDLFQKGREQEDLISKNTASSLDRNATGMQELNRKLDNSEITLDEYRELRKQYEVNKSKIDSKENQFLQLLNQGSNWVTFFVKSIIQDSAKKGFEKVLFPSGDTASKVEGHTTLEQFKKQKEDRIKELENTNINKLVDNVKLRIEDDTYQAITKIGNDYYFFKNYLDNNPTLKVDKKEAETKLNLKNQNEINQLKQELKRVEKEGFGALKPVFNFYETTIANVLNKQYGKENVKQVTDEYGNTWNELTLVEDRDRQATLLQLEGTEGSKASPETIAKIKQAAKKMGISIQDLADYAKAAKLDTRSINGVADLVRGVIAVSSGREDTVLTEEMVHLATAILEQTNPALVTSMISKIDRFQIYKKTLAEYKDNKNYQLPNGKPDIRKIKKEAVDRLIAEVIINQNEGDTEFPELMEETNRSMVQKLWETIKDYIKGIYGKTNIDIFQEAASKIIKGEVGNRYANVTVKDGVSELFDSTPELSNIGTPEQYSAYLDSIFPDSKVKDIVYHGSKTRYTFRDYLSDTLDYTSTTTQVWVDDIMDTDRSIVRTLSDKQKKEYQQNGRIETGEGFKLKNGEYVYYKNSQLNELYNKGRFEKFKKREHNYAGLDTFLGTGHYFTTSKKNAEGYDREGLYSAIVDIKNPYTENKGYSNSRSGKGSQELIDKGYDAVTEKINTGQEYNVFEPEQIHILGNEKDIQGFREFVASAPATFKGEGVFYQLKNDLVDNYYNKIMDVDSKTELIPETTVNGVKVKRHYLFDGIKVLQSVTEKIKQKAGKLFGNRTDLQKKMDEFKKNWGSEGHAFIQNYITNNLIDKDGYARKDFLDVKISTKLNETIQDALKGFSEELIRSYAPGTRFIIEKKVVNQKVKGLIASTVDFKAIEPVEINGKKDIRIDTLDWKFIGLNPSNKDDIPWYAQREWKEQMGEYTKIDYSYGAKPEQIRKTRMIPFIANYKYNIPGDSSSGLNLDNIEVGKLDSLKETRIYLLPVALNTESTGNAEIDKLLKSLRTQYEKLYIKSVSPQEKFAKTLQLNEMSRAIRSLHMKLDFAPLAAVGKTFLESAAKAFKSFENVDYSKLTVEDINKKLGSLLEFKNSAEKFEKLDAIFRTNFSDKEMTTEDKNVLASIEKVASSARRMKDEISKLQSAYVVQLGLIQGLTREETKLSVLNAQREVKGIFKSFAEASKIPNHLIRLSANLWMNAKSLVSQKIARDITDFGELLNPLEKEASAKGKSAFDLIGRVEDDGLYLIQKLSKKFMADVALAKEEQNKKFLLANIDIDLYNKLAKERIDKGIEEFQNTEFSTNEQQDYEIRESKINKLKDLLDINRESFNGYSDYEFSELFSETLIEKNHYSSEYKEMAQSKAALDVWNLFTAMNKRAKQMGYLSKQGLSFFPLMEASALQKLSQTNDFIGQGFDFFRDAYTVKVNEEQSFSKTDPETGKVKKQIPKLFTRTDKEVSQLSKDLNRVGTLWIKSLAEYENRKNTEHILLTLLSVERAKPQIAIDAATGETIWEGGVPQTIEGVENKNADLLEAIIDDYLYGLREDASSMGNVAIGTASKKLSDDEETSEKRALAAKKVLQNGDKLTQSLAVGLKLLVTIPNYIGVNMQAFINAGNFYTFSEFTKNNVKLQVQMSTIEKGLIDLIVPLNEDITKEKGRELAWKQSPVKWLGTWTFNDVMMVTNSFPEKKLQIAAAMSMNDNSMVINGKIVNIRQYLKKQDEARYKKDASGKYIMSESERRALEKTFESRVKELKATSALAKIAKIENGYVVIPGVSSEELAKYRTKIVENIRNLNGQMSEENKANYRRDTIFKSFMMFKNWIPKQVMLRGSNINKNLELNQWEYGRTRLFVKTWAQLGFRNIFKMQAILQGTDEGLAIMDEMLKAKKEEHFKRTGEELDITDEEFYDMVRRELSNQMKELGVLLGVMSLLIAAKVAPPPDEKDKLAVNRFKYFLKLTHKISDEIAFYYNPLSFESMTKGSVLPALGLLTRAGQFIGALEEETRGRLTGDQELQDKNHPVKYFFNMVPVGNQFQNGLLPYLAPDLAKENGIRVSPEARR